MLVLKNGILTNINDKLAEIVLADTSTHAVFEKVNPEDLKEGAKIGDKIKDVTTKRVNPFTGKQLESVDPIAVSMPKNKETVEVPAGVPDPELEGVEILDTPPKRGRKPKAE